MNFRIVTQPRLSWWPQIDIMYSKSSELRSMFTDTLNKVTQGYISHLSLRMIPSRVSSFYHHFQNYENYNVFGSCLGF